MSTANTFEQEMLALINAERTSRGLNPLQLETRLNDSSEDHSTWMLNTDTFSHTGAGGSSATQRMEDAGFDFSGSWRSGENIAWQSERGAPGISDDVEQLHQSLMNSPGHRANILNPDYEYIGIGIEEGDYNGWDAVMVTQNFATTDAAVVLDNGNAPTPPADDVAEPDVPVADVPDTDVTDVPVTDPATPEPEVTETEVPDEETPDTDVTETPVTDPDTPEPEVTETEVPGEDTPDTDVTETPVTDPETSEPEVTETEVPDMETPAVDVTDTDASTGDCFNVEEFLAAVEEFVNDLMVLIDDFRLNDLPETAAEPVVDDLLLTLDGFGDTPDAPEAPLDASADPLDTLNPVSVIDGCMLDFV